MHKYAVLTANRLIILLVSCLFLLLFFCLFVFLNNYCAFILKAASCLYSRGVSLIYVPPIFSSYDDS